MLALEKTINVPADRRVHFTLEVPETVPKGITNVVLVFPVPEKPAMETASSGEALAVARAILDRHGAAFRELAQ